MNHHPSLDATASRSDALALAPDLDDALLHALSDSAALNRYATLGDPRAFEVVTLRYRAMVLGTCLRALRSMADAEDATQETFLKLARHAKDVRASLAAWLHRTAQTTSLDQLRRRGARQRAHAAVGENVRARTVAGSDGSAGADGADGRTWAEMEHVIDSALSKLSDADRDLIVARFLSGRTQAQIAHELGVNAGTVHRRLDAALGRLREHLASAGLVVAAGALPLALACAPSSAVASPMLVASLGKVALAEMGSLGGVGGGVGAGVAPAGGVLAAAAVAPAGGTGLALSSSKLIGGALVAALIGVAITTGGLMLSGPSGGVGGASAGGSGSGGGAVAASPGASKDERTSGSLPRPSKALDPARLVFVGGFDGSTRYINFDGNSAVMYFVPPEEFKKAVTGPGPVHGTYFDIAKCDGPAGEARPEGQIKLVVREVKVGPNDHSGMKPGDAIEGRWAISTDGQTMAIETAIPSEPPRRVKMVAFRVPGLTSQSVGLPVPKSEGNHPKLAGLWSSANELSLTIDKDTITVGNEGWTAERFKILSWTEANGYAQVETICTGNSFVRGAIGKRVKMLVRAEAGGYSVLNNELAQNDKGAVLPETVKKLDQWPDAAAFDATPTPAGVRLQRFAKELP